MAGRTIAKSIRIRYNKKNRLPHGSTAGAGMIQQDVMP